MFEKFRVIFMKRYCCSKQRVGSLLKVIYRYDINAYTFKKEENQECKPLLRANQC